MLQILARRFGAGALLFVFLAGACAAAPACGPDKLGTERTLALSTAGGFAVGLQTYPQTLALADHEVVLTFDDGPWPTTTRKVLDALALECVKATFFLIGRNAAAFPALVRREVTEGHSIGNHTFSHPARTLRLMSNAAARADILRGFTADETAAYGRANRQITFFRFPGFADTPALVSWLKSRNIGVFGSDLWASDWLLLTPQAELDLVLKRLDRAGRGILLLHDSRVSTAEMLPQLLRALKQRGYKIVHIAPGPDRPPLRPAPPGWKSETEEILAKIIPRLAGHKASAPANKAGMNPNQALPEPQMSRKR
ncbi:MAG: polysaccharide deacetylase family protein [Methylovirgula sp.]|nr:polysaccharide deacetylase family protein [Methylovirgula sp.]